MYCLDTNVVIGLFRGDKKVLEFIEGIWDDGVFVTSITACELYKGAYGHINFDKKVRIVNDFLTSVVVLSEDKNSCREFGIMWQKLKKKGLQVGDFDCIIASIVKLKGLTLVTSDKHFKNFDIPLILI